MKIVYDPRKDYNPRTHRCPAKLDANKFPTGTMARCEECGSILVAIWIHDWYEPDGKKWVKKSFNKYWRKKYPLEKSK